MKGIMEYYLQQLKERVQRHPEQRAHVVQQLQRMLAMYRQQVGGKRGRDESGPMGANKRQRTHGSYGDVDFEALPEEVIEMIASHSSLPTLGRLGQSSRTLRRIATPLLQRRRVAYEEALRDFCEYQEEDGDDWCNTYGITDMEMLKRHLAASDALHVRAFVQELLDEYMEERPALFTWFFETFPDYAFDVQSVLELALLHRHGIGVVRLMAQRYDLQEVFRANKQRMLVSMLEKTHVDMLPWVLEFFAPSFTWSDVLDALRRAASELVTHEDAHRVVQLLIERYPELRNVRYEDELAHSVWADAVRYRRFDLMRLLLSPQCTLHT